jgi:hypothetical protein
LQILKRMMLKDYEINWLDLRDELKATYQTDTKTRKLRRELRELKQGNDFDGFLSKFRLLTNQLVDMDETEQMNTFVDALKPKVRFEVISKEVSNLQDAMKIARIFEECHANNERRNDVKTINFVKTEKKYQKNSNFNQSNNLNKNKFQNDKYKKKEYSNKTFKKHENKYEKTGNNKKTMKCYECAKEGHIAKDCFKRNKPKRVNIINIDENVRQVNMVNGVSGTLPTKEGKINGTKCQLLLDSGAAVSLLSTNMAKKLNIEVFESNLKIRSATDHIENVVGETEELVVELKTTICKEKFVVVESSVDVILGMTWFLKTNVLFRPADNTIVEEDNLKITEVEELLDVYVTDICDEDDDMDWNFDVEDKVIEIKPEIKLNKQQITKFKEVMVKVSELFAVTLADLKACNVLEHVIRVNDGPPVYIPPYRKSLKEKQSMEEEVLKMLDLKIIERSTSAWNSPAIIIPKKDGSKRFVIDYRQVNKVIVNEIWPMPRIDDIFDRLSGSKIFSALDLTQGYHQIELEKESRKYTAFSTQTAHYQFIRMPFGLKTAPAAFSRIMNQILGHLTFVEVYLDDITIHSKTIEEHFNHILAVAEILKKCNLRIKQSKCRWISKEAKILGHIVSGGEVKMDPDKITVLKERIEPKNVKQLQQFLGICNYYRKFIKDYAKIATPLNKLLKAENKFKWENEQKEAFKSMKDALIEYPVLRQPDFTKTFYVYTDASGYCLGAVLAQKDESGRDFACAYASKSLKAAELNYTTTEKECMAVVWAIKKFRIYLYAKFVIITDHVALSWLLSIRDPTGRLARWSVYLQAYDFDIVHRKGLIHSNADALSRPVYMNQIEYNLDDEEAEWVDVHDNEGLIKYLKFKKHISGLPKKRVKKIESMAKCYEWDDGNIYYVRLKNGVDEKRLVPVPGDRLKLAEQEHECGHFQCDGTMKRLMLKYYWKNMHQTVKQVVDQCESCKKNHVVKPIEHVAKAIKVTGVFDKLGIDLTFGLPETRNGFKGLLTIVDYLTKSIGQYQLDLKQKKKYRINCGIFSVITDHQKKF